jgi:hypothetical protein
VPDVSGDFLLAAALSLSPDTPLQWTVSVLFTPEAAGGGTMDVVLQPLALDVGSTTSPRTAFGETFAFDDVVVDPDGTFSLDLGVLEIAGETNPLTGSDAVADVVLDGTVADADNLCGDLTGQVTSPIEVDLAGSTFAMLRIDDTDPDLLPVVFPNACR